MTRASTGEPKHYSRLLLFLLLSASYQASALEVHSITDRDERTWHFTLSDDGGATIWYPWSGYYTGNSAYYCALDPKPSGTFAVPPMLYDGDLEYPVVGIGAYSFRDCPELTDIAIPASVSALAGTAFNGCSSLEGIHAASIASWCSMTFSGTPFSQAKRLYAPGSTAQAESEVRDLVVPDGIVAIPASAFDGCESLETVVVPDSVGEIGASAFANCPNLKSVTIGTGVTNIAASAFQSCTNLVALVVPSGVQTIAARAFHSCTALRSVTFHDGLLSIGNNAFWGCSNLTSVVIPATVTNVATASSNRPAYDYHAFGRCPNIVEVAMPNIASASAVFPDSYKLIRTATVSGGGDILRDNLFSGCVSLETATVAPGISGLGKSAFSDCTALRSVSLPDGLGDAGTATFYNCTNLTAVSLPNSVTNIGIRAFVNSGIREMVFPAQLEKISDREAFRNCSSLTSIAIPRSLRYVGTGSFNGCSSLNTVRISDVSSFCAITWAGSLPSHALYLNGERLDDLVVPDGVDSLRPYAFANSTNLTSVTLPLSVTNLGDSAFSGCAGVRSIALAGELLNRYKFPSYAIITNVTILPGSKTSGSTSYFGAITSLVIPDGVETIPTGAFANCSSLQRLSIPHSVTNMAGTSAWSVTENSGSIRAVSVPSRWAFQNLFKSSYTKITNAVIVAGETEICNNCFQNCYDLETIALPDTVTNLGYRSFSTCSSLRHLDLPDGITTIGEYAFASCSGLSELTIPENVQKIEPYAFYGWTANQVLRIPGKFSGTDAVKGCSADIRYYGTIPAGPNEDVPVPCEWMDAHVPNASKDYRSAVNATAANGRNAVWECYVAGLDPEDAAAAFLAKIEIVDGEARVSYDPDLGDARIYLVEGKETLDDESWSSTNGATRFFRVRVAMPE